MSTNSGVRLGFESWLQPLFGIGYQQIIYLSLNFLQSSWFLAQHSWEAGVQWICKAPGIEPKTGLLWVRTSDLQGLEQNKNVGLLFRKHHAFQDGNSRTLSTRPFYAWNWSFEPKTQTLGFLMPGSATFLICQIKRHSEGREKRFITQLGTCRGKRQSMHSVHLQPSSEYRHEL
jgi:hypothetical protein